MSLFTAVPFKHQTDHGDSLLPTIVAPEPAAETGHDDETHEQDDDHHPTIDKPTLWLGFLTGFLLETSDVGIHFVQSMGRTDLLWQKAVVSLAWSLTMTLAACIMMVCIQNVASKKDKRQCRITFMVGTLTGLVCAIAGHEVMRASATMRTSCWWLSEAAAAVHYRLK